MKLTCPSCGAIHSACAWENDAAARQCLSAVADLPAEVGKRALQYLALFRPTPPEHPPVPPQGGIQGGHRSRGLSWARALKILGELRGLVEAPHIQWKQGVARPCTPGVWAQAIDRMLACPPRDLPIESHGYLRSIAYGLADEMDRLGERARISAEQTGRYRRSAGPHGEPEQIDKEELRRITDENFRKRDKR